MSRTQFYQARPKSFINGKRTSGEVPFNVSLDLTKRRYNLLKYARGLISNYPEIKFSFADINCSLGIRMVNESFYYFNTESELNNKLKLLKHIEAPL